MSGAGERLVAIAIGIAFGFALERAGLGSARKLSGQFLLRDFTVVKVMFSAIVTAMLGTFWLGRLGVIDVAFLYVPETHLWPQIAGGLVFGAGFALAGLCPGTACVSAATGRGDGLAVAGGLFAGVTAIGLWFAPLQPFYESGGRGAWTLPALLHLPAGVVVFLIVAFALAAFALTARQASAPLFSARQASASLPSARQASASLPSARQASAPLPSARQASASLPSARQASVTLWLAASALALGVGAAIDGLAAAARPPAPPPPVVRPHSGC